MSVREGISTYSFLPSEYSASYKAEDRSKDHDISESDLRLQLSATRRFLLGSENSIESPTCISQLKVLGEHHSSREGTFEASIRKENSYDWIETMSVALGSRTFSADFSSMLFDQSQGASLGTNLSLTVAQKQCFSIREVSPEWAFSGESTKVYFTFEFVNTKNVIDA